jgi:alkylated DNA nucleotide flippase Atl1
VAVSSGLSSDAPAGSATEPGDDFVSRVLGVVESIPDGRVMTYGDVAATIGSRAARAVGHVMALYGDGMPWWRVIRSSGHPPVCHENQALEHYEAEDTPLVRPASGAYRVNLRLARWRP